MNHLPLFARAIAHGDKTALVCGDLQHSYSDLVNQSTVLAHALLDGSQDLQEARVAFLAPAGIEYVTSLWAIWLAGGIAIPLSLSATDAEVSQLLADARVSTVLAPREIAARFADHNIRVLTHEQTHDGVSNNGALPELPPERRAMMLFTSGTTSKPKGVVLTHGNLQAQIESLVEAWQWAPTDRIPLFLPLHHIHGIVNVLSCALWSGAAVDAFTRFDAGAILPRVADGAYSVFMAVPTVYVKLIERLEGLAPDEREAILAGFRQMRLMVSGSASLPVTVFEAWEYLTGQRLLERYGMTEIGMALSNPYTGERRPGAVGQPLPGVQVRLRTEQGKVLSEEDQSGEIEVRGPTVFSEYWDRAEATQSAFDDGWFKTGDIATLENGYYRILGRNQIDIIKSGGFKLSALEIESALLEHPDVRECAVIGMPDDSWGEIVAVAIVPHDGAAFDPPRFRDWTRERLSSYKVPRQLLLVEALPRNAMGKVTKPAVRDLLAEQDAISL